MKAIDEFFKGLPFRHDDGVLYLGNTIMGAKRIFRARFDESANIIEDYWIITKVMNPYNKERAVLILFGTHSQGIDVAGEFITNHAYLRMLIETLGNPTPKNFQVLFHVSIKDGHPYVPEYIDHRVIP